VGHIYGRRSILGRRRRNHMFTRELLLNIAVLRRNVLKLTRGIWAGKPASLQQIKENLVEQIAYYRHLLADSVDKNKHRYLRDLNLAGRALRAIPLAGAIKAWTRRQRTLSGRGG